MLTAVTLIAVLATEPNPAHASDYEYLVDNPEHNESGTGYPKLWGVQRSWVIDGQSLQICSDWGPSYSDIPLGIRQAITSWEHVLPGTQLGQNCSGSGGKLWLRRREVSSGFPSSQCAGYVGCIPDDLNDFTNDTLRNAYYPSSQEIWFDDINFSFTDNGWRATAGHELGHIFGLDEYYIEGEGPNDVECNPNPPSSVMNALSAPGNVVTGPCSNGSLSPTQRDIDLVEGFYRGAPPIEFNLRLLSPGIMGIDFKDREWAEAGYQFFAYRWTGSTWAGTGEYWVRTFEVGNKDYWNDTTYYKGVSQPDGYYKVCVAVMTEIYWLSGWECSDEYIHMGDHDIEVDYVSAIGPAAVNLSVTQPREMWVLAEMTNQGDYTEEVMFSLEVYLSPPSGCWRSPPGLVLPGSEERYLFSGETSFAVYRILYECHAPATPQYFDQVVSFRADLASGNEPADAKGNNTKAANKTVIVE